MALYARLNDAGAFSHTVDLTAEHYAALQVNGKSSLLRPWSEDAKPIPSPTQALVNAGIVVTAAEARQTWALRDKTAAELGAEENEAERTRLREVIAVLSGPASGRGTAAERTARLERIAVWLLRRMT